MGKKSRRKSKISNQSPAQKSPSRAALWALAALLLAGAAAILVLRPAPRTRTTPAAQAQAPYDAERPFYANPEDAKPFPATMDPARFEIAFVSRAYEIAREIPEVLVQQPCDCNCGVLGHRSLLDCYASPHAASCTVCLKEAVFSHQMTLVGMSPAEIREDIDEGRWRTIDLETR